MPNGLEVPDAPADGLTPKAGFKMVHIQQTDLQGSLVEQITKGLMEPSVPASVLTHDNGAGLNGFPRTAGPAWRLTSDHPPTLPTLKLLRSIPTTVLYDDRGLDLFDDITKLEEYYLTGSEAKILQDHAGDLVRAFLSPGMRLVELGAGSMCKTAHLLDAVQAAAPDAPYYALDLCTQSLQDSLQSLYARFPGLDLTGLVGTYDAGIQYLAGHGSSQGAKMLMWLGSSVGNYTREEAAIFLRKLQSEAMAAGDMLLIGIDRRNAKPVVEAAYNDREGVTRDFIMNGLRHSNTLLGRQVFNLDQFEYAAGYDEIEGRHEAYYRSKVAQDLHLKGAGTVRLQAGELLHIEYSYKYSPTEAIQLAASAGLCQLACWTDPSGRYDLHLWQKGPFCLAPPPSPVSEPGLVDLEPNPQFGPHGSPLLIQWQEWQEIWKAWDAVTLTTVPLDELHTTQPISLRHPLIFYVGHAPAFLDLQLNTSIPGAAPTKPANFLTIFARGIDPDVEDPSKCHSHSIVPDAWPSLDSILNYRDAVRDRLHRLYCSSPSFPVSPLIQRALHIAFEHEAMHLETYLYMLVQMDKPCPPAGVHSPAFEPHLAPYKFMAERHLVADEQLPPVEDGATETKIRACSITASQAATTLHLEYSNGQTLTRVLPSSFVRVPAGGTTLGAKFEAADRAAVVGHSRDSDSSIEQADARQLKNDAADFKWDNEMPEMNVKVAEFDLQSTPVTVAEYWRFLLSQYKLQDAVTRTAPGSLTNGWTHSATAGAGAEDGHASNGSNGVEPSLAGSDNRVYAVTVDTANGQIPVSTIKAVQAQYVVRLQELIPSSWAELDSRHAGDDTGTLATSNQGTFSVNNGNGSVVNERGVAMTHNGNGIAATAPNVAISDNKTNSYCGAVGVISRGELQNGCEDALTPDGFGVRTLFGPVPLEQAWNWPVFVNCEQAAAYAAAHGLRLPTEAELMRARKLVLAAEGEGVDRADRLPAPMASFWAAAIRKKQEVNGGRSGGAGEGAVKVPDNVGFRCWGPRPVPGVQLPGHVDVVPPKEADVKAQDAESALNGALVEEAAVVEDARGVTDDIRAVVDLVGNGWEWTSTLFAPFPGFKPDELYPEYSVDFFDGKHAVAVGASWATHPRIANRVTFRNFYQTKYPYAFGKFRCVKDVEA